MSTATTATTTDNSDHILLTQDGYVATIAFNRPERHNAWLPSMGDQLERFMRQCAADDSVRVIVLTGNGKHFCAGADMEALKAAQATGVTGHSKHARSDDNFAQRHSYMMAIPKPIICALNGSAVGVGLVVSLFCDLRFATEKTKLAGMFSRRGLVAEHGIAWVMQRLIGVSRTFDLLVSGRTILADEAERMGLLNAVFPEEVFREEVAKRAHDLANNVSPRSARLIKRQVYEATYSSLAQAAQFADDALADCIASDDFKEGIAHFMEKRPPQFTGR